ncbi:MAG: hypothetical protein WBC22_11255 [Sedimentisphaerales bacterium]
MCKRSEPCDFAVWACAGIKCRLISDQPPSQGWKTVSGRQDVPAVIDKPLNSDTKRADFISVRC